jgi:bifunctional non-homologous end joining protein LigD
MTERRFGERTVKVTSPDKVLFPDEGIRKGDIIDYYERISHIQDRPLMLHRFPNGIHEKGFLQKNIADYFPHWINQAPVKKEGGKVTHREKS